MADRTKVSQGTAVCIYEPQCRHGLEGYNQDETYRFEKWQDNKGIYVKVFPNPDTQYFEIVPGPVIFEKYFSITEEQVSQAWQSNSTSVLQSSSTK